MIPNWSLMSMSDPLNHFGSIWYHSEPSDVPYSPYQFLTLDFFLPLLTARLLKRKLWTVPNLLHMELSNKYIHVSVVEPGKTRAVLYVIDSSSPETIGASTVSISCATSLFDHGGDLVVLIKIIPILIN